MIRQIALVLRLLGKSPTFTASALLCLSLGTGANVAVFSIASAVLSRPLPVERSEDLVLLSFYIDGTPGPLNAVQVSEVRSAAKDIALAARTYVPVTFSDGKEAYVVETELVTANYFAGVLRPRLLLGRAFENREDEPSDYAPVIISRRLWRRRFNDAPDVIGKSIRISARDAVIVGIASEEFNGVMSIIGTDAWVPMGMRQALLPASHAAPTFGLVGRLTSGQTIEQVRTQLETILPHLPSFSSRAKDLRVEIGAAAGVGIPPGVRGQVVNGLSFLAALAVLVLAIAVANVVSLLLIRGALREREFGIRTALGADRGRLIRDALLESLVLTLMGAAIGTTVAWWATGLIPGPAPGEYLTSTLDLRPDRNALWFAVIVAIVTGLAAGLIPALRAGSADPLQLMQRGRTRGKPGRGFKVLYGFVVAQMALSIVLTFGAGLLVNGYLRASDVALGFDATNVLAVSFDVSQLNYDESRGRRFYDRLLREIRALPDVRDAALASGKPFGTALRLVSMDVPVAVKSMRFNVVSPEYFDSLRIEFLAGRNFTQRNEIVVNQTLARTLMRLPASGRSPLGMQFRLSGDTNEQFEVVGVVKDVMVSGQTQTADPSIYRSFDEEYRPSMTLLARMRSNPGAIMDVLRRVIASIDRDVAIVQMSTLKDDWANANSFRRQLTSLFSALGLLAMTITGIGIYGVVGYTSSSRQHEFAVRVALGGQPKRIAWQVLRSALSLAVSGLIVGLPLGFALSSLIRSSLFGVTAWQPQVITAVAAIGVTTALVSSSRAAWIASRTEIAKLLRQD